MAIIQVKNIPKTDSEHVYQGSAVVEVRACSEEGTVELWGSDPSHQHGAFGVFLNAEEARTLAKQLLQHAATIESGIAN